MREEPFIPGADVIVHNSLPATVGAVRTGSQRFQEHGARREYLVIHQTGATEWVIEDDLAPNYLPCTTCDEDFSREW